MVLLRLAAPQPDYRPDTSSVSHISASVFLDRLLFCLLRLLTRQCHSTQAHTTAYESTRHSAQHITQHSTRHKAHDTKHTTQSTRHSTRHTAHDTQHTTHSTRHTTHNTQHTTQDMTQLLWHDATVLCCAVLCCAVISVKSGQRQCKIRVISG